MTFDTWWEEHGSYLIGQITFVVAQKAYLAGQASVDVKIAEQLETIVELTGAASSRPVERRVVRQVGAGGTAI